jgi:hypothetical protein
MDIDLDTVCYRHTSVVPFAKAFYLGQHKLENISTFLLIL